ncbi:VOC family protein [Solimicrobium silvestre]|uniref:VOC domain-containing protein n=1 Tax=Solimicrobium silvestre TaxID=2099400 RepID=A0A2S9H081_9BURK|nr:VOC family protein [Solimicrobium silvestre]PRC93377.1 hypothetical protein S2091_1764 [Solimicrobium silvestre]
MSVKSPPAGFHSITPALAIKGAARAIEFYKEIFGAVVVSRYASPDGVVGHAELKIGDSHIMVSDEYPDFGSVSPLSLGGSPVTFMLYMDDVDSVVECAVAAGATLQRPVADQFHGDRTGTITDPFGHKWTIAKHIEDVSSTELSKRAQELFGMSLTKD